MARTVKEIMNRELFSVRSDDSSADVLNGLLALGISGSPVLDAEGRPTGMVSLRDLAGRTGSPQTDQPLLSKWLARPLRFRTAPVGDPARRRTVLEGLLAQARHAVASS